MRTPEGGSSRGWPTYGKVLRYFEPFWQPERRTIPPRGGKGDWFLKMGSDPLPRYDVICYDPDPGPKFMFFRNVDQGMLTQCWPESPTPKCADRQVKNGLDFSKL